jgi:short-subunit dehydrogenase involved in D-alanine esterification of teichoic acids
MGTETQTKPIRSRSSITQLVSQIKRHLRETRLQTIKILYNNEGLIYARDTTDIDKFVKTLRDDYKLTLNDPDPIDDFLGIHFSRQHNGELHMSQTGLIDAVTESALIPKGRLKNTPTPATGILHADTEGLARQESWNYPSVIGQLNYLAQNS